MFKSRRGAEEPAAPPTPAESIEAMRRRARHRLIGAVVLVLLGVIGFPLLFDTQPRPVAVDLPIEIPDRNKVKPLPPLPPASAAVGKASSPVPAAPVPAPAAATAEVAKPATPMFKAAETVVKAPEKALDKAEPTRPVKVEPKAAEAKAEPKREAVAKAPPTPAESAKALAILEGRPVDTAEPAANGASGSEARFVVQVGAYSDATKAREARLKLEKAGLKTYTHVADTKDGKRIRVRTGPYATRAEADKAADRIKGLDLPAAILSL